MSVEKFLQDMGFPVNADLDSVEGKFVATLKERIQRIAQTYDEDEVGREEKDLRAAHAQFFAYTFEWVRRELKKERPAGDHPNASKLRAEAQQNLKALNDLLTEFTCCYMHIGRFMTLLRDEIRGEEVKRGETPKNLKWTADAGIVIARYKKEKKALLEQNMRMKQVRSALTLIENEMKAVQSAAVHVLPADKWEALLRSLTAALRVADFRKAEKTIRSLTEEKKKFGVDQKTADQAQQKIKAAGAKLVMLVQENQKALSGADNRLFLRVLETEIAHNANVQELRKIKIFLNKYYLPYMEYKLGTLEHLKDKLMVVGSLDGLFTLYKRLVAGLVAPMPDIKTVRLYESEVVAQAKYLITGLFDEIPKIHQRAQETVQEFRQNKDDFIETENLDLVEIEINQSNAAGGS